MMTTRKRTQKDTADTEAAKDISGINDVATMEAELASIHERENAIRDHAKGMLDDARKEVEAAVNEYNKLMEVSGTGGGPLSIHEEGDGNGHGDAETARAGDAEADSGSDTGKREKPSETPSRASGGHGRTPAKTQAGPDDDGPLDPDAVSFADKDGVVVDDPTTMDGADVEQDDGTDGGAEAEADADADADAEAEADDEDDTEEDGKGFDFLGE